MNKLISFSLAALLAGASVGAQAAPRDGYDQRGHNQYQRYDRDDRRHDGRYERRHDRYERRDDRRHGGNYGHGGRHFNPRPHHGGGYRPHVYPAPAYYVRPRGYRPHRWAHGHYLPRPYYGPSYYVDYRPYQLAPPPYGHRWVRVDNDVLLVALTTGLVADAVYGLFH
jgi:Ni/Co efflux regulator RcnB